MKKYSVLFCLWFGFFYVHALDDIIANTLTQTRASDELKEFWTILKKDHIVENFGNDQDFRHKYVGLQGVIETVLAARDFKVIGIVHTQLPCTPLRNHVKQMPDGLISDVIKNDPKRLQTVVDRTAILRAYLKTKKKLYVCYPQPQKEAVIPGMDIYQEALKTYSNLIDKPFAGNLPKDLSGATYIIKDHKGQVYCFSLLAKQANSPEDQTRWAVFFGLISDPLIKKHLNQITSFLETKGIVIEDLT